MIGFKNNFFILDWKGENGGQHVEVKADDVDIVVERSPTFGYKQYVLYTDCIGEVCNVAHFARRRLTITKFVWRGRTKL